MFDDVRAADTPARAERVLVQFKAWQLWQRTLGRAPDDYPDDWQAFRRDMTATGADISMGQSRAVSDADAVDPRKPDLDMRPAWTVQEGDKPRSGALASHVPDARPGSVHPTSSLAAARARGEQMRRDILSSQGELLDRTRVAARLQLDRADVDVQYSRGLLVGLPIEDGTVGFPAWQFTETGLLPGLEDVLRGLGVRNVWMRAAFFLSGDLRLDGRTPLEALLDGEIDAVRSAASAYGEQLAS